MGSEAATVLASAEARSIRDGLLTAAAALVDGRDGPGGFVRDLFGRTSPEDLAPYTPEAIADLALAARRHLAAPRIPGTPCDLRLSDLTVDRDGRPRELTVVEVVNDNRPFLLASALAELTEQGLTPHLVAHPILGVERSPDGSLVRVVGETTADAQGAFTRESFIHLHLDRLDAGEARDRLEAGLAQVFRDVARATDDRDAMDACLAALIEQYGAGRPSLPAAEVAEAHAFLEWLRDGHFTLLGLREYALAENGRAALPGVSLGVLRDPGLEVLRGGQAVADDTPEIRAFLDGPQALLVTKSSIRSRVRRAGHLDYIGIKLFSDEGTLAGEVRLVGLFTATVNTALAREIPYLRKKVDTVIASAGLDPTSHAGRSLLDVLETYPRDDLFQIETDRLYRFTLAIGSLAEHPRIRVLPRPDRFGRFVSVLVYVPKDRYDSQVRTRIGLHLARTYGGRLSAAYPDFPEGSLARTHYIIGLSEAGAAEPDPATLEAEIGALVRTWGDDLRLALAEAMPGRQARALAARYADAFSAAYRESFEPRVAIADIAILDALSESRPRAVDIGRREADQAHQIRLKVFSRGGALSLSDRVPALENLGFRVVNERTYRIRVGEGPDAVPVWLHDMLLERATGAPIDRDRLAAPLEAALLAIAAGDAESDGYNRLVLEADLGWRDVALLRGLGRYLRQLRVRYGQGYLAATLARHPAIAARIVALFHARFDPAGQDAQKGKDSLADQDRAAREAAIRAEIEEALASVTSLDDDRILRRFVNLVEAAVRTNFFQTGADGGPRETIAFKFACAKVSGMPLPRPFFEIFVYAPRLEGVHLRYGYVARGGLRWSDRPEDFRTEILGLVKAQQVKNAVIVPVGAKGGFFPKRLPPASDREAWLAEGTESYRVFIRTLLELTDNIVDDAIRPPADTVRHDTDDAYLVVAADKGTATFSDIANALSLERGHWLGDAFASGGSQGYDHKRMGITARGAWEAVKRHFREMDVDVQSDPVTVVGVGDMSGDVFGNGMLLSESLKLVAAFDHRDIFLDPAPDPAASFGERRRLFDLPRSSWRDYDPALLSRGGGVFSRSLKTIPLSPEIAAVLGVEAAEATPAEVMQAILKAPADLLWFGGIGTYVRATTETDAEAGDRANDAVRITGADVRAKVVGEGANLGMTQRGRIEAARAGIRLNTDAIDNSAGVNTSDVEVNIKIALMGPERDGRLNAAARNALLVGMTDEVAALVLRNNELQTLALSLALRRGAGETAFAVRTLQALEAEGRLDRAVEFLPDDAAIAERVRRGEGLTRPEYAVLLAYAKLSLYDAILASPVPNDPYFDRELQRYFPQALRSQFPDAVKGHRLRREIIATALSNIIVNRGGPSLVTRLIDETGADAATIAKAYAVTRDAFGLMELNLAIDRLAGIVPGQAQLDLYADVQDLLTGRIVWFIRNLDLSGGIAPLVARYRDGIAAVMAALPDVLDGRAMQALDARQAELIGYGLPPDAARRLASLAALSAGPDIVRVAEDGGRPVAGIAATHFALAHQFRLDDLVAAARKVSVDDIFDRIALERAVSGISTAHRRLTAEVVADVGDGPEAVEAWIAARGPALARIRHAVEAIAGTGLTVSKATVAASLLADLARP
ncbi:NAD-specific glutamate dehydrogenase [Methylobacterium adhaesivum]|uniref:NAD-glutamate dehydrogenase n=1 Tax=Methylobacterium adhaesivum TaxID=333297 RepID=A0ABT8BFB6_9HYPH|nr:NAD-glutamate dehydrogenase [Methylobacterium adhaesivum]MDN3590096.1 NAD-glutamate dehydrogenase [Methylobacterium adhaesivum]GJD29164.1 NAD-specific glutamate dehydrogenase [Methylobacterium adhaesivum]